MAVAVLVELLLVLLEAELVERQILVVVAVVLPMVEHLEAQVEMVALALL